MNISSLAIRVASKWIITSESTLTPKQIEDLLLKHCIPEHFASIESFANYLINENKDFFTANELELMKMSLYWQWKEMGSPGQFDVTNSSIHRDLHDEWGFYLQSRNYVEPPRLPPVKPPVPSTPLLRTRPMSDEEWISRGFEPPKSPEPLRTKQIKEQPAIPPGMKPKRLPTYEPGEKLPLRPKKKPEKEPEEDKKPEDPSWEELLRKLR